MVDTTIRFIQADWHSHKIRFFAEVLGMVLSISVAVVLALTTPAPPMLLCYTLWLMASGLLVSTSYHRGSVGFTLLYGLFLIVDSIGFFRTLLS